MSLDPQTKKLPLILATAGATAAVTLLAVNFSVGGEADHGAHHPHVRDCRSAVPALDGRAARPADRRRQPRRHAAQRRRDLSGDARGDPRARRTDHLRDLHLLVRRDRQGVRRRARRARARRRPGPRAARLGRQQPDGPNVSRDACETPASRSSATTRCTGTTSRGSTTARTASSWSSTAGSASPAASASPTSGAGNAQDPDHWRDTHFRVEGPVVAQMQAAFIDNWIKATRRGAARRRLLPAARAASATPARADVQQLARRRRREHAPDVPAVAIAAAERTIDLASAYFVPDELAMRALRRRARSAACGCGSSCPGRTSTPTVVRRASRASWGDLLRAGARDLRVPADDVPLQGAGRRRHLVVSVGSTNFDNRSFRLNDEANLNVYGRAFAERQIAVFEDDLKRSRRITFEEWEQRPWTEKLRNASHR